MAICLFGCGGGVQSLFVQYPNTPKLLEGVHHLVSQCFSPLKTNLGIWEQLKDMLIIQIIRLILASGQHTIQIDNYRLFLSHAMNVSFYTQSILHVDRGTNLIHLSKSSRAYFVSFVFPLQVLWGVVVMSLVLLISCGVFLWQPTVIGYFYQNTLSLLCSGRTGWSW